MASFVKHYMVMCHTNTTTNHHNTDRYQSRLRSTVPSSRSTSGEQKPTTHRRTIVSTLLAASTILAASQLPPLAVAAAAAQNWGGRSYVKERYFQPEISPEDSAARIRQTAEGLHEMRHMLDTMSWRYVLFYVRFKMAYLSSDLKNAMMTLPEGRRKFYVKTANELVDNMTELDHYVRTPKVYESYLYYEKTLKSIDDLVAQLA